jgi:hypothetical protein
VKCVIQPQAGSIALVVTFGIEQVKREIFDAPIAARERAEQLQQRLVGRGWREVTRS